MFLVKRGVATNGFFYQPVFWKMWKVMVFFCHFWGIFWLMFKKHYKNRYFSTFLRAKKCKEGPFFMVNNWATLMVNKWGHVCATLKLATWPSYWPLKIARPFFCFEKSAGTPIFIVFFDKQPFRKKTNVAQLLTIKSPQMWPSYWPHSIYIDIYIYIYILCVCGRCLQDKCGNFWGFFVACTQIADNVPTGVHSPVASKCSKISCFCCTLKSPKTATSYLKVPHPHICNRVNIWSKIWGGGFETISGPSVVPLSGPSFFGSLFCQLFWCFGACAKSQMVWVGTKIVSEKPVRISKMRMFRLCCPILGCVYVEKLEEKRPPQKEHKKGKLCF